VAVFAGVAYVLNGLETRTLADLVCLDVLTHLDTHTCSFVPGALGSQLGHLGESPVVEHKVDIAEAEAGGIELDEDIVRTCRMTTRQSTIERSEYLREHTDIGNWNLLDLDVEVRAFVFLHVWLDGPYTRVDVNAPRQRPSTPWGCRR
jgi:hypothetical protein